MKKTTLLLLCGVLFMGACQKIDQHETPSADSSLTGEKVDVGIFSNAAKKLFVLNEGQMGSNNATLDFLRFQDGNYITGAFKKMNPSVGAGLGDTGNDIVVIGDEAWIVVNNSGIVEVISVKDETEVKAISIPTPRFIAFDDKYAYVTSYAGSYYDYNTYSGESVKGQVYRINLKTKQIEGNVEVGYQPEGIACYKGKLYVANSGGLASMLPPTYSYDNTVSIIDAASFKVIKTVEVQVNLQRVYSDGKGKIYVTNYSNYADIPSGLNMFSVDNPDKSTHIADYVSFSAINGDTVYCVGTDTESDWSAVHEYKAWKVKDGVKTDYTLNLSETSPFSLYVLDDNVLFVGDAGDYFNPGKVSCYWNGNKLWSVQAGVSPGHFAIY